MGLIILLKEHVLNFAETILKYTQESKKQLILCFLAEWLVKCFQINEMRFAIVLKFKRVQFLPSG